MTKSDIAGFSCLLTLASIVGGFIAGAVLAGTLLGPATTDAGEQCGMAGFLFVFNLFVGGVAGAVAGAVTGIFLSLAVTAIGTRKTYQQQ